MLELRDPNSFNQRAIPLAARKDLQSHQANYLGQACWVVKDPVSLKYFRLEPAQFEILQLLDGQKNVEEVLVAYHDKFPTKRLTRTKMHQAVLDLYQKGLAWSTRSGQGLAMTHRGEDQQWQKTKQALKNILFVRLPGFDPTRILDAGYGIAKWVFHPAVIMWAIALIVYSWVFMITHASELAQRLPGIESLATLECTVLLWIIIGFTKIFHELGHAFACRHTGGECHEIGMAFLVFSPCLYCDVSDSWTLTSKWRRIGIAIAGVYVELLIATLAFFCWWESQPGTLNQICFLTFVVSSVSTLLFNLNPLLRLDGYYVLSDWLEIPNLRQKADKALENALLKTGFGIKVETESLPAKTNTLFVLYSIASAIYRTFLVFVICFILYSALKPVRLEFIGLVVAFLCTGLGVYNWTTRIRAAIKKHEDSLGKKQGLQPLLCAGGLAGALMFVLFVPIPISLTAPVNVEYANSHRVFANSNGQLAAIHVRPGQTVKAGQILIDLFNVEQRNRWRQLVTQQSVQEIEVRKNKILVDAKETAIATEKLQSFGLEIADLAKQLKHLQVRAPVDGKIIEPRNRKPSQSSMRHLPNWDGTPMDPVNIGCHVEKGTHLFTVAPSSQFQAVLAVNQLNVHAIQENQSVRIKFAHLPGKTFVGKIERIATAANDPVSETVDSSNFQSDSPKNHYLAMVRIDGDQSLLMPGVRGTAKVTIESQTAAQWIWRNVKSTFNFEI